MIEVTSADDIDEAEMKLIGNDGESWRTKCGVLWNQTIGMCAELGGKSTRESRNRQRLNVLEPVLCVSTFFFCSEID